MAACMFNAAIARQGLSDQYLALSAGTYALSGAPASDHAQLAMQRRGLALSDHRSQAVTGVLLEMCDLIVGITPHHLQQLRMMYPRCCVPMIALVDPPVSDPYGGDEHAYEQAACDIQRQLPALISQLRKENAP